MTVYVRPNGLAEPRLGLSVGRRVGSAVRRNRVKRLLREAFRLSRHGLPTVQGQALDVVVNVRPHEPRAVTDYQRLLLSAVGAAARLLRRRDGGP